MQSFEKSGFHLHKTNRQFQQRIPNRTTIEAKLGSMLKNCKQRGFFVASAQMDDFEQIRALWDRLIDPYAFTYISHDQWQQEIQAGRLQCVKDEKGIVVAAQQYSFASTMALFRCPSWMYQCTLLDSGG